MSEPIVETTNNDDVRDGDTKHDFTSMIKDFVMAVPWKLSIGIFVLLLIVLSKQFIEYVLYPMGGDILVDGDTLTNTGIVAVCIISALGLILMDTLIKLKML